MMRFAIALLIAAAVAAPCLAADDVDDLRVEVARLKAKYQNLERRFAALQRKVERLLAEREREADAGVESEASPTAGGSDAATPEAKDERGDEAKSAPPKRRRSKDKKKLEAERKKARPPLRRLPGNLRGFQCKSVRFLNDTKGMLWAHVTLAYGGGRVVWEEATFMLYAYDGRGNAWTDRFSVREFAPGSERSVYVRLTPKVTSKKSKQHVRADRIAAYRITFLRVFSRAR